MRLDHLASAAVDHLLGRLIKRALVAVAMAILAMVAIYHFTVAGIYALELQLGQLDARLIVGGIYATATLIALAIFWAMGGKPAAASTPTVNNDSTREMQLVMLVEAVMLGYSLARKREQVR